MSTDNQTPHLHVLGKKRITGVFSLISSLYNPYLRGFNHQDVKKNTKYDLFEFCMECGKGLNKDNKENEIISKFNTDDDFRKKIEDYTKILKKEEQKEKLAINQSFLEKQIMDLNIEAVSNKKRLVLLDCSGSMHLDLLESVANSLSSFSSFDLGFFTTSLQALYNDVEVKNTNEIIKDYFEKSYSMGGTDLLWLKDHLDKYNEILLFSDGEFASVDFMDKITLIYIDESSYNSFLSQNKVI